MKVTVSSTQIHQLALLEEPDLAAHYFWDHRMIFSLLLCLVSLSILWSEFGAMHRYGRDDIQGRIQEFMKAGRLKFPEKAGP